jgi:hypothetical protein
MIQAYKFKSKIMNAEKDSTPAEKNNLETDTEQLSPEVLDMIKHPPRIDDALRDLPLEERINNPALVPEMLDDDRE